MMDDFGLYPREEPFDPLGVMLFKALQVIAFLFFLALLAVSPDAKDGKIDSKAEFMITLDWPDSHPDDLDLFVQDPAGNIAWYRHREAGFLTLDRDDRGGANDFIMVNGKKIASPIREEIVTVRGIVAGEYTVNVSHFVATTGEPVQANVKVQKLNPTAQVSSTTNSRSITPATRRPRCGSGSMPRARSSMWTRGRNRCSRRSGAAGATAPIWTRGPA